MIEDHSHSNQSSDSRGKLVLPAVSLDHHSYDTNGGTQPIQMRNARLPHQKAGPAAPANPFAKLGYYWRSGPAHQFLIIVVSFATVVGFIFAGFMGLTFAQPATPQANQLPQHSISSNQATPSPHAPSGATATASGGPSNPTNETLTPTPVPSPTPTPTPEVAPLTLRITSVPKEIDNDTTVDVTVQTNQPGIPVRLTLSYTKATGTHSSNTHQADDNGKVVFHVQISVVPSNENDDTVKALLIAVAQNQNHQFSQSQSATLLIHVN